MNQQQAKYVRNHSAAIFNAGADEGKREEHSRIIDLLTKEREHHRHSGLAIQIFNQLITLIESKKND
jgi:hypothetical protein